MTGVWCRPVGTIIATDLAALVSRVDLTEFGDKPLRRGDARRTDDVECDRIGRRACADRPGLQPVDAVCFVPTVYEWRRFCDPNGRAAQPLGGDCRRRSSRI